MNLYVGTSGYSYPEWKGSFYPEKLPANQMLRYYGEHFRSLEVNYTFRRMPTKDLLKKWAGSVPAHFRFVLKIPELITHRKRLNEVGEPLSNFLKIARTLGDRLGPLLFQLPPNFKKDIARLRGVLKFMRPPSRAAFEFRHSSWFDDEVFGLLRDHQAALCVAEEDNDFKVPFVTTTDWGYLRLRRTDYTGRQLSAWVRCLRKQDWEQAFVFFKHEDEGRGPRLAKRFLEFAAKRAGSS